MDGLFDYRGYRSGGEELAEGRRSQADHLLTLQLLVLTNTNIHSTPVPVLDPLHLRLTSFTPIPTRTSELIKSDSLTRLREIVYFHQTPFDDLAS